MVSLASMAPRVWTEFLRDSLDTPAQCAARTGMLPNDGTTGAPVTDFPECDNYAQGSARVTFSGTGPNGVSLQERGLINLGFLADSFRDQIDGHLAKTGGTYSGRELITDEDTSQFAFADDVHPTPYAHQKTAEALLELMASAGWQ